MLVTGGAGFIGSHLVDALVKAEAKVTVLDNLSTGNKENLAQSIKSITFIEGDIRDSETCLNASKESDYIFHLAACVSVALSMHEPEFCHEVNVTGTFNLLNAARKNKIQRFVLSSSCAVYGQQTTPCAETTPCNPASPYASSKWIGELLCQQYAGLIDGVPSVCLRYFNVIGERQSASGPYAGVFAKFSQLMAENKLVTIFGDGNQSRDFIPVTQVVKANMHLALLPKDKCNGQPINIGTGKTTTVLDIYNELKLKFNYKEDAPCFVPAYKGDIYYSCADIALYERLRKTL